ncbi:protein amalgam-like isoform X2 [Eriocheir sinensis]|nr:protein amalgam-like isoform X2 [Eriocheir sinensis]XP_050710760.1 protein amalgam-like isoform X2 [Eriocheir sinensis]XP_050710761.1 protein amalgam-like isoform X2 [Eriocheir sinensis]
MEESKEVPAGPRLVSRLYSRLILSRGASTTLNCTVEEAGNVGVSWVRNDEVLAVGRYRYTNDQRMAVLHEEGAKDYSLRLSHLQPEDSALYECRVATEPLQVAKVKLIVIDAYSVIFGANEVRVTAGGKLFLLCLVLQVTDVPEYILWYQDETVIDYLRPSITVKTEEETRSSELQIHNISFSDAGNYTCHPSNAAPSYVIVHVSNNTNKRTGKAQKCDDCVLFIQLGATFAFFTLSFLVAFCFHSRENDVEPPPPQDDYENYYYSDDKML